MDSVTLPILMMNRLPEGHKAMKTTWIRESIYKALSLFRPLRPLSPMSLLSPLRPTQTIESNESTQTVKKGGSDWSESCNEYTIDMKGDDMIMRQLAHDLDRIDIIGDLTMLLDVILLGCLLKSVLQ